MYKLFQTIRQNFRLILLLFFGLIFVYTLFFSKFGLIEKWELKNQKKELITKINNQIKIRDSLLKRIEQLNKDTFEIEKIARKYYGLVKEDEKIYVVGKKKNY